MLYQLSHIREQPYARLGVSPVESDGIGTTVGDTGIEPVTSSVSGKRAPAAPIARADDGTRTRDPHLGKVMLYQLSHIRVVARPEGLASNRENINRLRSQMRNREGVARITSVQFPENLREKPQLGTGVRRPVPPGAEHGRRRPLRSRTGRPGNRRGGQCRIE